MSKSFFLNGNRIVFIANAEGADLRYRAQSITVAPGVQVAARRNEGTPLIFLVERGGVEFMVDGATAFIASGELVRVPRGATFAFRNSGMVPAQVLSRHDAAVRPVRRVTVEVAA